MNIAQALDFINSQLMANTLKTLSTIETTILKEAWKGKDSQTYKQIGQNTNYDGDSIKQAAYELWKRLKQLCGETVNRDNVQAVVERYYNKVSIASPPVPTPVPTPSAPTYTDFVGREGAIAHLNTRINQGAKVILIQAPGGVGKTTLAQEYLKSQGFDLILELLMAKEKENITLVESVIEEWLKRDFQEEPGREFGVTLGRLKRQLQTRRVGILIDNLEPALDGQGRFIEPHRSYVDLLRVLADYSVQSVTLITSREPLAECVGVTNYPLPSLDEKAWHDFFSRRDIEIDEITIQEMHKAYGGNALAMNILCDPIQRDGGMVAYWQEHKVEADLLVELAVENLVKEQFNRLEKTYPEAYRLLCRLGCYRYQDVPTVPTEGLLCLLWDVPEGQRRRVIESLRSRSLVECLKGEYWLHPVIRAEAISRLRDSEDWEEANRKAADFWTDSVKKIEAIPDAMRAFEAYHHCIMIYDIEQAAAVIVRQRYSKWRLDEPLTNSFYRLGLLQEMIFAINQIINRVSPGAHLTRLYNSLGNFYWITGALNLSIKCHKNCYNLAVDFQIKELEIISLSNIGLCQIEAGELEEALLLFEKVNSLSNCTNLHEQQIGAWFCLALIHSRLGFCQQARLFIENVCSELSFRLGARGTGYRLVFLGQAYKELGEKEKSLEMYHNALLFAEESHYTQIKAKALYGLAELYRIQGEFETALSHHSESIELLDKIGAKSDLAEAYYQRALTYQKMGNTVDSEEYFNQAITLYEEMEAPKQIARVRQSILMMS
ncbi:tetratricopeptide repeat protein [Microcoleus asticus]|uniref:Uncharacterized protein n=1 Tax=Microcoleus asticus IPMA8 TaxID=2563858 RepID=A0ABX2D226_9CYAN|nr:tetratricopeptide repeat protein [Microcoleus asticus]NQE36571.1 hypothetical protein [Microcoleus asticus IPMA8]